MSLPSVSNAKSSGVKQESSSSSKANKGPPRKHPCEKCPYVAVSLTSLYNHVKIVHDNIREHVCAECGFKSGTSHGLMAHTKSVHLKIRENGETVVVLTFDHQQTSALQILAVSNYAELAH